MKTSKIICISILGLTLTNSAINVDAYYDSSICYNNNCGNNYNNYRYYNNNGYYNNDSHNYNQNNNYYNSYNPNYYYDGTCDKEILDIYNYGRENYYHEYHVPSPSTSNIHVRIKNNYNQRRGLIMPDIISTYVPPVPTEDTITNIEPTDPLLGLKRSMYHLSNGIKEVITATDDEALAKLHKIYNDFQLKTQIYTYITTNGAIFKLTSKNSNVITQLQSKVNQPITKGYIVGTLNYSTSMTVVFSSIPTGVQITVTSYDPFTISTIQKESDKITEQNIIEKDMTKQTNGITVILTSRDLPTVSKLQNEVYNSPQFFW